ncbi:conserved repeat domain-containing protein [Monaibacterium marinum]|uniref:Conserved repeat domain-containing protein n=1 Tax=Pontivivens marinum TaxID=1690039 RepID=A0A2C9CTP9_9RHOB|nr:DUF11 domain-containing protein [Monaibacterium marinum]SOH94580.1 conserved repeat domain-containing protein [Monaibacterium marinum]
MLNVAFAVLFIASVKQISAQIRHLASQSLRVLFGKSIAIRASISLIFLALCAQAAQAQDLILNTVGNPTVVGSFTGKRAIWQNAGTVGGTTVDIVGVMAGTTLDHNFQTGNGRIMVRSVGPDPHFLDFTLYRAGTYDIYSDTGGVPVVADINVQINDLDGPNNEELYVKMCDGTVQYVRVDRSATTYRGYIPGPDATLGTDTFFIAGDRTYENQPTSGLEIFYPQSSTFSFGRSAENTFFVQIANPTYVVADTYEIKCGDFQDPLHVVDDYKEGALGEPVVLNILLNDGVATNNDNGPANNSGMPSDYALQAVDLIPPFGAINVVTDSAGHRVSFDVVGEGTWSYDDVTGELTFTPFVAFFAAPTPIDYRYQSPIVLPGDPPIYSNTATVTIDVGSIGLLKLATLVDLNLNGYADAGEQILYTFTLENFGNLDVTNVSLVETEFSGAGVPPVMTFTAASYLSPEGTLVANPVKGEVAVYTALYTIVPADLDTTISNQARATGETPSGTVVSDDSDSENPGDGDGTPSYGPGDGRDDPTTIYLSSGPDRGDAPLTYGDPQHTDTSDYWIGDRNGDGDSSPQFSINATGDDLDGIDDENDEDFPQLYGDLTRVVTVVVNEPNPGNGYLQAWVDFGGQGTFLSIGDQVASNIRDGGPSDLDGTVNGEISFPIDVPASAVLTPTFVRLRWSSVFGLNALLPAVDGEVEDYGITIKTPPDTDRGDAPVTFGDPQHIVEGASENYMGVTPPDIDLLLQNGLTATGDDLDGSDDEDGVVMPILYRNSTAQITVSVTDSGSLPARSSYLQAYIDFSGDGTFGQAGEQVALNLQDGDALDKDGITNGEITFEFDVPAGATLAPTFARFRWSTDNTGLDIVFDGEVEDYDVTISNDPPPLICDSSFYRYDRNGRALARLNMSASGSSYSMAITDIGFAPNDLNSGWGYNEVDGYLYSMRPGGREVYRMDGSGTFTQSSSVPFTAATSNRAGDILPNGTMVYVQDANRWQMVSLTNYGTGFNLTDLGDLQLSQSVSVQDFAYNPVDGFFYGIDQFSDQVVKVDANGGIAGAAAVTAFGPAIYTGTFSSAWFDEDGHFYVYEEGSNGLYLVDTVTGVPFFLATSPIDEGNGSDGASCRGPSLIHFGAITGNVYNDSDGSDVREETEVNLGGGISIDLYIDNGTADISDDYLLRTVETQPDGTYSFDDLLISYTYRVELDESDPDIGGGLLSGTSNPLLGVVAVADQVTANQDFGFDPSGSDLSITKIAAATGTTTAITNVSEGDTVDWIISISNAGSGSPSSVKVIDRLPSGFAYVSDNAPATGDTYDPDTGLWFVDEILAGATETLIITTTVLGEGNYTNYAEIVYSSLPDPDSDPSVGRVADDLGDGIADDDEASYTLIFDSGSRTLSGHVFIDNGIGGATAHDAEFEGAEAGTQSATLDILDGSGSLLATVDLAADGTWTYELDAAYTGNVTIRVTPDAGFLTVSEKTDGLFGLVVGDPHDGEFEFEPTPTGDQVALNIGLVAQPSLTEDQVRQIQSGQITVLPHVYEATSDGTVTFSISQEASVPSGAFSSALYTDPSCNGTPGTAINAAITVTDGQTICLVSRVTASSGASTGSRYTYTLNALTTFTGTTVTYTPTDQDVVTVSNAQGEVTLSKTVENETQLSGEGATNSGAPNDILLYRIYLSNQSAAPVDDIKIYDRTPPYTSLAVEIPTPVQISPTLSCELAVPGANTVGYQGAIQWNCTGVLTPGDNGAVTFRVRISP